MPTTGTIHNANNLLSVAHGDIANVSNFPITNNSTSTTVHGVSNVAITGNGLNNVVTNVHGLNNLPTVHNLGSLNSTNVGIALPTVDNANTANNLPSATRGGSTKNNSNNAIRQRFNFQPSPQPVNRSNAQVPGTQVHSIA